MSKAVLPPTPEGRAGCGVESPWLLSGAWAAYGAGPDGGPSQGGGVGHQPVRRTARDWVVDVLFFVASLVTVVATVPNSPGSAWAFDGGVVSIPAAWYDLPLCGLGCLALWWRRRWPVGVALACAPLGVLTLAGPTHPTTLAVFTVAVHRPARTAWLVAVPVLVTAPLYFVTHPESAWSPPSSNVLLSITTTVAVVIWGMLVHSRRQVLVSLAERAQRAEADQRQRVDRARQAERDRIAREMHDVLAHRISLVGLHAGALEYRPDAAPGELARAAGVIRANAHQALQELREVIGLLRDRPDVVPGPVLPDAEPAAGRIRRPRWTVREGVIDGVLFVASTALVALLATLPGYNWTSQPLRVADLTFGVLAGLALWGRRRWPVAVAWACAPLGMFVFSSGLVAALVTLFTVAACRTPRTALPVGAVAVLLAPLHILVKADLDLAFIPAGIMWMAAALGWGMLTRTRRQLVDGLRERAVRAAGSNTCTPSRPAGPNAPASPGRCTTSWPTGSPWSACTPGLWNTAPTPLRTRSPKPPG